MKRWAYITRQPGQQDGFTIVELLIVIVVIAILAVISIVAYNGIQARGRNASAQSTAKMVAKKAEIYNVDVGYYPLGLSTLTGAATTTSYYVPSVMHGGTLTNDTPTNAVNLYVCGSGNPVNVAAITNSNVVGGKVYYRDYQNSNNKPEAYGTTDGTGVYCYSRN